MTHWKKHKEASKNERRKVQNIGDYIKVTPEELDYDTTQQRRDFIKSINIIYIYICFR